jgi:mannosyltransferase OCH1-like enzyme
MIPRIIHQSYRRFRHPYPRRWQRSWKRTHPRWEYRFHTDLDNEIMVRDYFPQFFGHFCAFPQGIMRADFCRFIYLFLWGGVYADLDYVCLKPFDGLIDKITGLAIPCLPQNMIYQYHNALLISEAGHPFWLKCAEQAARYFESSKRIATTWLAGPNRLQATLESSKPDFVSLSMQDVTPLDWYSYNARVGNGDKEAAALRDELARSPIKVMREAFPKAYAITFWEHRW